MPLRFQQKNDYSSLEFVISNYQDVFRYKSSQKVYLLGAFVKEWLFPKWGVLQSPVSPGTGREGALNGGGGSGPGGLCRENSDPHPSLCDIRVGPGGGRGGKGLAPLKFQASGRQGSRKPQCWPLTHLCPQQATGAPGPPGWDGQSPSILATAAGPHHPHSPAWLHT